MCQCATLCESVVGIRKQHMYKRMCLHPSISHLEGGRSMHPASVSQPFSSISCITLQENSSKRSHSNIQNTHILARHDGPIPAILR